MLIFIFQTLEKLDLQFNDDLSKNNMPNDIQDYFFNSVKIHELSFRLHSKILSSAGGGSGGALTTGRIALVTKTKHGYVNAPALILRPPSGDGGHGAVCIVLLPLSYVSDQIKEGNIVQLIFTLILICLHLKKYL